MKRYFTLLLSTAAVPVFAMGADRPMLEGSGQTSAPAVFFVGGCLLILVAMAWLAWNTRKLERQDYFAKAKRLRDDASQFPDVFPDPADAVGRDSENFDRHGTQGSFAQCAVSLAK